MSAHRQGFLGLFRTDGNTVRALLLALVLQILLPLSGVIPAQAAPSPDSLVICTAQGMVTMVPDGQGGWKKQADTAQTGIQCAFCLPLLGLTAQPAAAPGLALPIVTKVTPQSLTDDGIPGDSHVLSARPRGPPASLV
ncbi:DUF2946 family protein [Magnetospirillum sp. 64-120]|uniref:DUF2946 family protein n=1 Tax=Magnetospirillum sp. 64-120 TaxID=1895778 RepID=UPI0025B91D41|nr:DUF2946 family protein [Magnetospirillum sp. 64-120]